MPLPDGASYTRCLPVASAPCRITTFARERAFWAWAWAAAAGVAAESEAAVRPRFSEPTGRGAEVAAAGTNADAVTAPGSLTAWLTPPGASKPLLMQWFVAAVEGRLQPTPALVAGVPGVWRDLLEPGRYVIQVQAQGLKSASTEVEVRPGETVTAALTLEKP